MLNDIWDRGAVIAHRFRIDPGWLPARQSVLLAAGMAIAYYLAARVGLALVAKPQNVAVFWPASGVSAGLMIAGGPKVWRPVAAGVAIASFGAHMASDHDIPLGIISAFCNAAEAFITAGLLRTIFGPNYRQDDLPRVLGFLGAAVTGAAIGALAAAVSMVVTGRSPASMATIWQVWFAADVTGIVTVAPSIISLLPLSRAALVPRRDWIEGVTALLALTGMSVFSMAMPLNPAAISLPSALLLPVLLWLGARCKQVFSAAAIVIFTVTVIFYVLNGVGQFGDAATPFADRVFGAQIAMSTFALGSLSVAALFSERRRAVFNLAQATERLQLALDATEQGVWSVDVPTGRFESDERSRAIRGFLPHETLETIDQSGVRIHPADLPRIMADFLAAQRPWGRYSATYRVLHPARGPVSSDVRWVASTAQFESTGKRMHGVIRDITTHKLAEIAKEEGDARLRSILDVATVVAWQLDVVTEKVHTAGPLARLFGQPDGFALEDRAAFRAAVHADDHIRVAAEVEAALRSTTTHHAEFRVPQANGEMRWLMGSFAAQPDAEGAPRQVQGVWFDITQRKVAELALLDAQRVTAVACEAGQMGTWHLDCAANRLDYSDDLLRLIGLSREEWGGTPEAVESFIHPDDRESRRASREKALAAGGDMDFKFRIHRRDGEVRWLHSRGRILCGADGRASEGFGVMTDITELKHAEAHLLMLIAELDHRVKNTLAQVSAVAQRTREGSQTLDEYIENLDGRIDAMAHTHSLLSRSKWQGASLAAIVKGETAPYATGHNITVSGLDIVLNITAAQTMATVFHELATNAAKYGALSRPSGHVTVRWKTLKPADAPASLVIDWREQGGPVVVAPAKPGYGMSVVRGQIPYELRGKVDLTFTPEGVECRIELPLHAAIDTTG